MNIKITKDIPNIQMNTVTKENSFQKTNDLTKEILK